MRNLPITFFITAANGQGGVVERAEHPTWGDAFVTEWQAFHYNVTAHSHPKTSPADFRHDLELFQQMSELMKLICRPLQPERNFACQTFKSSSHK